MKNGLAKVIYDTYKGQVPTEYASLDKSERDGAIRKALFEALGLEEIEDKRKFKKAFNVAWRKNKNNAYEIIEELVEQVMIDGDYAKNAFYERFVEVRNEELGDSVEFYVEGKNDLVVQEFSGSHFDLKRRRVDVGQSFRPSMRDFGVKVYEYFERVASGRASIDKLVALIIEAIDKKLKEIGEATFIAAVTSVPATYKVSGSYDEDGVLEMLAHLEAENGVKPALVGTATAIRKLQGVTDVAIWADGMKNERNQNMILPVWNGYDCLEISQGHKLGTVEFTLPVDEIYCVAGDDKPVKLVLEGISEVKEISDGTDNADKTLETAITFKAGTAVVSNKMIGVIDLA